LALVALPVAGQRLDAVRAVVIARGVVDAAEHMGAHGRRLYLAADCDVGSLRGRAGASTVVV